MSSDSEGTIHWNFKPKRTFVVDVELVHLAVEMAASEAQANEVRRQFAEQFPGEQLGRIDATTDMPGFHRMDINLNDPRYDYTIELRGGTVDPQPHRREK